MKRIILLASIALLSACSSAPNKVNYYLLDKDVSPYQQTAPASVDKPHLTLMRVKLASYLSQPQLAMQQQNNQIYYATQHLWAESLYENIRRSLINDLTHVSDYQVRLASDPKLTENEIKLEIQIDHLVATDSGKVILAGKYWLIEGKNAIVKQDFYFSEKLTQSGFSYAIEQQRGLLKQLSAQINQSLPEIK